MTLTTTQETSVYKPAPLKPDQLTALREFRRQEGRKWKKVLLKAWETASYPHLFIEHASVLQNLRNTHGPSWLKRFELKPVRDRTGTGQ